MTQTRLRLLAVAAGAAVGLVGRGIPTAVAIRTVRVPRTPRCGMEEVLECVVRDSGTIFVGIARVALATVVISATAAVVGTIAVAVGLVSRRRVAGTLLVGVGVMLVMPALWLLGSFLVLVAT